MLELVALNDLAPQHRQSINDLDLYQHIIFISANAVRFGLDCIDDYWPQLRTGINWYAIGESTAAILEDRGLQVITPGEQMSSEGLLAVPELSSVTDQRVLIVKGTGGRETLRDSLGERGARVDELACYRRSCPNMEAGELAQLLYGESIDAMLISSGEGFHNMLTLLSDKESTKFRDIGLIVPSARVATLAREAGFNDVVTAANASDGAMLQALQQWRAGD
jgi:uroporphyrinogen-III synthase